MRLVHPPQGAVSMKKILDATELILKIASGLLLCVIAVCLFYAVIMRYVFHLPPAWSMELSRFLFMWMVIFSACVVTREKSHIQILFLVNKLPDKMRFVWMNILRLMMMWFCWVVLQQGMRIYPMVSEASSPTLGLSMGWLYSAIPLGALIMGVYLFESIVDSIVERINSGS